MLRKLETHSVGRTYTSIDPAPATSGLLRGASKPDGVSSLDVSVLREQFMDKALPLFERYRAMFALRNIGTPAAVDALATGFSDNSALFKFVHSLLYMSLDLTSFKGTKSPLCLAKCSRLILFHPF